MTTMLRVSNFDDPSSIDTINVVKIGSETFTTDKGEQFYKAWIFPMSAEAVVREVVRQRAALKKSYDDSQSLIFELRNKVARGEFK